MEGDGNAVVVRLGCVADAVAIGAVEEEGAEEAALKA